MAAEMGAPIGEAPGERKSRSWLVILIVVLVLCCVCAALVGGLGWFFGDQALEWIQSFFSARSQLLAF